MCQIVEIYIWERAIQLEVVFRFPIQHGVCGRKRTLARIQGPFGPRLSRIASLSLTSQSRERVFIVSGACTVVALNIRQSTLFRLCPKILK